MKRTAVVLALFSLLLTNGCGYHFAGTTLDLPPDVKSVHVGDIGNETKYAGLEKNLSFALENAILRWNKLRLAETSADSDAILAGKIRYVDLRAVSFDQSDLALQYEVSVVADLYLRRTSDGKILWSIDGLRQTDEFSATAQVVVTSSQQFQEGTLDAQDLPNFTEVQLSESQGHEAMNRLLRDMARDAYALMTEGF